MMLKESSSQYITKLFDAFLVGGKLFIILEYLAAGSMLDIVSVSVLKCLCSGQETWSNARILYCHRYEGSP
jgi:hypothetical protein